MSGFTGFKKPEEGLDANPVDLANQSGDEDRVVDASEMGQSSVAESPATGSFVSRMKAVSEDGDDVPELKHHYTSRPVARYVLGRFEFTEGYLSLTDEDAEEFENLLFAQPVGERARIRKLDRSPTPIQERRMFTGVDHSENSPAAAKPTVA